MDMFDVSARLKEIDELLAMWCGEYASGCECGSSAIQGVWSLVRALRSEIETEQRLEVIADDEIGFEAVMKRGAK